MDMYSSGEDLLVKTRKPYTITKQRERWAEDEHNRFLEALKLHGRAWQRIEEHIGTKTAVQIRSHAQKFFSKLEKEALVKGVPAGQALEIDIPPPRPKRKPSNPYPRKTCQTPTSLVGAKDGKYLSSESSHCKQSLDLEKEQLPEKPCGERKLTHEKENQSESCSEALTQLQGLGNACSFREFVPSTRKANLNNTSDSYIPVEFNRNQNLNNPDDATDATIEDNETSKGSQLEQKMDSDLNHGLPSEDVQATQNYPRHVPVHVLDGRAGSKQTNSPDLPFQEPKFHNHNFFPSSSTSGITHEHQSNAPRSSNHQSFQPFSPLLNSSVRRSQEEHQSFLDISSTFSSLIVSTLFQNPAAHAAANFAASFWPYCGKPSPDSAESSHSRTNPNPGMAAIAAATVAAATAWWASHGLLPVCAPLLHGSFPCTPPVGAASLMETDQAPNIPLQDQMEPENSDTNSKGGDDENAGETADPRDSDQAKNRKLVDRSSCGSNTASSSDIETDALEKKEEEKEDLKEPENENLASESNIRRIRNNCSNPSDSWKEVSEEGRLAFQALFSREVLPQSFSPPPNLKNMREDERERIASLLDLNIRAWGFCYNLSELEKNALQKVSSLDEGALTIGLGQGQGQGRLKARRTGFKPYKRCSGEVKDSRLGNPGSQVEEKANKRLRLEGEVQLNV